jgi:cell division protein FtsA
LREVWATIVGGRGSGHETPTFCTFLDLGTEQAKALVVQPSERESLVVGAGTAQHEQHVSRQEGAPVDVPAMVQCCDQALRQAEDMTEHCCGERVVPDWVVVCVPSCMTVAQTNSVTIQRSDPARRVSEDEFGDVLRRAQRLALRQLGVRVRRRRAEAGGRFDLLETAVSGVWIDGRSVTSPLGLTGEQMTVAVFNVAIQSSYMEVVKAVTERLGLETLETLSAWSALASATRQKDGVCIDVGGSSTDVMLILAGSVWATASIPLGGSEFTAQIARGLDIAAPEAERLKLAYGLQRLEEPFREAVRSALLPVLEHWVESLGEVLQMACGRHSLPRQFSLCGGSSVLPDLVAVLRSFPWSRSMSGSLRPEVVVLRPWEIPGVLDRTGLLTGQQYVPPLAIAGRSARGGHGVSQWGSMLRGVKKPAVFVNGGGTS